MSSDRFLLLFAQQAISPTLRKRATSLAEREGLAVLADTPGLFCAAAHRHVQTSEGSCNSIVLGEIYHRSNYGPSDAKLSGKDHAASIGTGGASLLKRCWGSFVAIARDAASETVSVLRSPFGRLALYYTTCGGTIVSASSVDLVLAAADLRPSFNWAMITMHLMANQLRDTATCLDGVRELLPGFRLVSARDMPEMAWNPADYCKGHPRRSSDAIAQELRATIDSCTAAWSRTYDNVVLGVSGGLDSSIVAASAAAAGAKVCCLTLATKDPAGDERQFARDLTDFLGIELFEFMEDPQEINLQHSAAAHLPRPTARSFAQSGDRRNRDLAEREGATAFFSGGGGDNVFCYIQSVSPVVDALTDLGLSRRTWQTVQDLSVLTGASLWQIARRGLGRAWRKRGHSWRIDRTFLSDRCEEIGRVEHPWLDASEGLPPGKQAHIALLLYIQNHLDGFGRERALPVIAPLLSQPIVEYALSVPSWMWLEGGANRAPARRAYADALPRSVLDRRSKGTPDSFVIEIFQTHRLRVRNMLMGGLLAQSGLLDIPAIDLATSADGPAHGLAHFRLLKLVDVEAWLRAWQAKF